MTSVTPQAALESDGPGTPNVLRVSGTDANIGLVLAQKGTGAIMTAVPDGTSANGNARGINALDLQLSRAFNGHVASGPNSVLAGSQSTASGNLSVCFGSQNTASGQRSIVSGGESNTASGGFSWVIGGTRATTRSLYGLGAWASGQFATGGDAQASEALLRSLVTDATPGRLTADNVAASASNTLNLPNNSTYSVTLNVVAQQTGGSAGTVGDCAAWHLNLLIKRGANAAATAFVGGMRQSSTAVLIAIPGGGSGGLSATTRDAAAAGWLLSVTPDTTNGGLFLTFTGELNKTIRVVARVSSVEVTA